MNSGRRFGGEGMRRGARVSQVAAAAAEEAVTLEDIYARHTWLYWFDGSHGVSAGVNGAWTDRIASYVLQGFDGATLTATTLGGLDAVRLQAAEVIDPPSVPYFSGSGPVVQPARIFVVASSADTTGATASLIWSWTDYGGHKIDLSPREMGVFDTGISIIAGDAGANVSTRTGTAWDDSQPHVVRLEHNATHASHVLRIDGTPYATSGSATADASLAGAGASFLETYGQASAHDITIAAVFACAHAGINDTQSAAVETDLMGL